MLRRAARAPPWPSCTTGGTVTSATCPPSPLPPPLWPPTRASPWTTSSSTCPTTAAAASPAPSHTSTRCRRLRHQLRLRGRLRLRARLRLRGQLWAVTGASAPQCRVWAQLRGCLAKGCPKPSTASPHPHPPAHPPPPAPPPTPNAEPGRGGVPGVCVPVHAPAGLPRPQDLGADHVQRPEGAAAGRV
jgi:hypothetical protein